MAEGLNKSQLIEEILNLAEKTFRELIPMLPKEWLQLDLTAPQIKIVLLLFLNGPSRMSVIASSLSVTLPTATGFVDRLVERDIVFRENDPDDRRVVVCRLTKNGEGMIGRLWQLAQDRLGKLLEVMSLEHLLQAREVLEALLAAGRANEAASLQVQ